LYLPVKLTLHPAQGPSRFAVVREGESLVIGRDPDCGLEVDDTRVSRHHARLRWNGQGWVLDDLESKNGTSHNGEAAAAREVNDGDEISLGGLPATVARITNEQAAALAGESAAHAENADRMRSRLRDARAPADLLECFLQAAMELTRSQRGFVVTVGPDGKLTAEAAAGLSPDAVQDERFQGSVGAVRQVLEKRGPVVLSDVRSDPRLGKRPSVVSLGIASLACVPIRHGSTVVGVIYVDSRKPGRALSELELETLEDMAHHVGAILALSAPADRPAGPPASRSPLVAQLQQRIEELIPAS
jgi:putative methionine-R-sulfoxide reductase with GAF domain